MNYAPERRLAVSVIFWTTDGYGPEKAGAAICALMRTRPHNALTTAKARVHDERLPSKLRRKPNEAHGEIHGELTDADFNRLTARGCPNRKSAGSDTRFWTINKISRRYDNLPASFHYSWPTAVMHDSRPLAQGCAPLASAGWLRDRSPLLPRSRLRQRRARQCCCRYRPKYRCGRRSKSWSS